MMTLEHMPGPARALARVGFLFAAILLVLSPLGCASSESSEEAPETGAVETASKDEDKDKKDESDKEEDKKDESKKGDDEEGEKKKRKKPKERTTSVSAAKAYCHMGCHLLLMSTQFPQSIK